MNANYFTSPEYLAKVRNKLVTRGLPEELRNLTDEGAEVMLGWFYQFEVSDGLNGWSWADASRSQQEKLHDVAKRHYLPVVK